MYSFKNKVLSTLLCHNAGSLQNIFKIPLGRVVLLARGRSFGRELDGIHICPLYLDAGKGHPCTFNTDRSLHGFEPWAGTRYGLGRPQLGPAS